MRMKRLGLALAAGLWLGVPAAWAENIALLIGNRGQDSVLRPADGPDASVFRRALREAGFRVIEPADRDIRNLRFAAVAAGNVIEANRADRLVIVATGPFATDGRDSWVLSNNAQGATRLTVGALGISMTALTGIAAQRDIPAVILVAPGARPELGQGLRPRLGAYHRDKRVTYVTGPAQQLADLLADALLAEGVSFAELARAAPEGVKVTGDLSDRQGLMGPVAPAPDGTAIELGFWQAVQALDTIAAYRVYLGEYPEGAHRQEAQDRIAYLREEPEREAQSTEKGLDLSRDDRREIQRNLSLLGYDPRGIDGIFGPGSRAAIGAWQEANGFGKTGYLTGNQVLRLRDQARAEAERQEEEARRRRAELERQDRAYWQETGRGSDEAGLRAYLDRYPDGLFADVAQDRLDEIEETKRAEAAREERDAWDAARNADTIDSYRAFLNTYPNGTFAGAARARLDELTEADRNAAAIAEARRQERQFTATLVARIIIEQRLAQLGADPGPADGNFTRQTRRAIRQFQRARDLPVTGYVSQITMVRLMAGR